jgi:hypothetical protein
MGKIPSRIPNYSSGGGGNPTEHANNEAAVHFNSATGTALRLANFADGETIVSASITITKKCCIVVVTTLGVVSMYGQVTQIRRGGVDKTKEITISNEDNNMHMVHLQYATEVLDAGTYQYALVNTHGSNLSVNYATMKIVAVAVE